MKYGDYLSKTKNPFYDNHLFSKEDIKRATFSKWDRLWLWIFPTHVQVSEGYTFHFKTTPNGHIWLMKYEKINS